MTQGCHGQEKHMKNKYFLCSDENREFEVEVGSNHHMRIISSI